MLERRLPAARATWSAAVAIAGSIMLAGLVAGCGGSAATSASAPSAGPDAGPTATAAATTAPTASAPEPESKLFDDPRRYAPKLDDAPTGFVDDTDAKRKSGYRTLDQYLQEPDDAPFRKRMKQAGFDRAYSTNLQRGDGFGVEILSTSVALYDTAKVAEEGYKAAIDVFSRDPKTSVSKAALHEQLGDDQSAYLVKATNDGLSVSLFVITYRVKNAVVIAADGGLMNANPDTVLAMAKLASDKLKADSD